MPFEKGNKYAAQKGEVRNPKGRPKGALSFNDELRKLLNTKDKRTKKSYLYGAAIKILKEAMDGNDRYMIEMWHQIDGMPKQKVDVESEGGINININFTDANDER